MYNSDCNDDTNVYVMMYDVCTHSDICSDIMI